MKFTSPAMTKQLGAAWQAGWPRILALVIVATLLWVIIALPRMLFPTPSNRALDELGISGKARLDAQNDRLKLQNDSRTGLIQAVGGAIVLLGAYLTWRQYRLNQAGQLTDRFAKGIEQLGSDSLDIQLGGIHSLERIAKESPVDHEAIASVLSAFVRRRSPWPPSLPGQYLAEIPLSKLPDLRVRNPSVHAAITILCRFPRNAAAPRLRLSRSDLRKASLSDANLQWALLNSVHFEGSVFADAHLENSTLVNAHLEESYLAGAHLEKADMDGAHFDGAHHLDHAHFKGAGADVRTTWPEGFDPAAAGIETAQKDGSSELEDI